MRDKFIWTESTKECYYRHKQGLFCDKCCIFPELETLEKCELFMLVAQIYAIRGEPVNTEYHAKEGLKKCQKCKETLPVTEYHKNIHNKADGYDTYCKKCRAEYKKELIERRKNGQVRVQFKRKESILDW